MLDIQFIELNAFVTLNNKIYIHLVGDRKFKPNMTVIIYAQYYNLI